MRVTTAMTYQRMILNLNTKTEDAGRLANMIATGKRLGKPQDDPRAWSQAMDLRQGLREIETFQENLDFAITWNQTTVNTLNSFAGFLDQAMQIGNAALTNAEDRAQQIQSVDLICQQALDLANTRYAGRYLFSGRSLSTPPFDENLDYQGGTADEADLEIRTGPDNRQVINITGEAAFIVDSSDPDESNVLKMLQALKTALEDEDLTEVQNQITALEGARDHITGQNTLAGLRMSYFDGQKSALETLKTNSKNRLAELEDADTAEAIILMQQNQTALQAALQATAMLDDLNLAKFL